MACYEALGATRQTITAPEVHPMPAPVVHTREALAPVSIVTNEQVEIDGSTKAPKWLVPALIGAGLFVMSQ